MLSLAHKAGAGRGPWSGWAGSWKSEARTRAEDTGTLQFGIAFPDKWSTLRLGVALRRCRGGGERQSLVLSSSSSQLLQTHRQARHFLRVGRDRSKQAAERGKGTTERRNRSGSPDRVGSILQSGSFRLEVRWKRKRCPPVRRGVPGLDLMRDPRDPRDPR